jgi:hypothetical protein
LFDLLNKRRTTPQDRCDVLPCRTRGFVHGKRPVPNVCQVT